MNIEEMIEKCTTGEAIYTKYCMDKSRLKGKFNCFFEGKDNDYYGERIKETIRFMNRECRYRDIINNFPCNGKDGVKYVYEQIGKNNDGNIKCFFIDRDYEDYKVDDDSVYITPGYSIENLYVTLNAFQEILISVFRMNPEDENFKKCCRDYEERMNEFHEHMLILNAWLYYNIKKENNVSIKDDDIKNIFSISILEIRLKKKYDSILDFLEKKFPNIQVSKMQLEDAINYFEQNGKYKLFKGKFELVFLIKMLESIQTEFNKSRKDNTNPKNYFSFESDQVTYTINMEFKENTLYILSSCAETPECLKEFLINRLEKYFKSTKP